MKFDQTEHAIRKQTIGMGTDKFEIAINHEEAARRKVITVTTDEIVTRIRWLKHENAKGANIYIRPKKSDGLILISNLILPEMERLRESNYRPSVILEVGPNNYQAWVRLIYPGSDVRQTVLENSAQYLADRLEATANKTRWGYLAGFTNHFPAYKQNNGFYPFVLVRHSKQTLAPDGMVLLDWFANQQPTLPAMPADIRADVTNAQVIYNEANPFDLYQTYSNDILKKNAHEEWASNPDWVRMDWMITRDMYLKGIPLDQIKEALLQGSPERQRADFEKYVHHTVDKLERIIKGKQRY